MRQSLNKVAERHAGWNGIEVVARYLPCELFLYLHYDVRDSDSKSLSLPLRDSSHNGDGLEVDTSDRVQVLEGKPDNVSNVGIISAPDDCRNQNNADVSSSAVLKSSRYLPVVLWVLLQCRTIVAHVYRVNTRFPHLLR